MKKPIVIIPAYNEEKSIVAVVTDALKYCAVCVVNDASNDATAELLGTIPSVHVIHNTINQNIAASLLKGMSFALAQGYDFIITMDAGSSHDPHELKFMLENLDKDLVLTLRRRKTNVGFHRKVFSRLAAVGFTLVGLIRWKKLIFLSDVTNGFRAYSAPLARALVEAKVVSSSFGFHFEALCICWPLADQIERHPIIFRGSNTSFNINGLKDGVGVLFYYLTRRSVVK